MNIFDESLSGLQRVDLYRSEVLPEAYPDGPRMLVDNWPLEDREAYCGIGVR